MLKRVTLAALGSLPRRARAGHKGTFGTVTVLGGCCRGSVRYIGAPALSALGALRSGCGLCRVLSPEPIAPQVLRITPSATGIALKVDRSGAMIARAAVRALDQAAAASHALVLGPGMGQGAAERTVTLHAWSSSPVPLVLDADGLNNLASRGPVKPAGVPAVITPHPGEAQRLIDATGIKGSPTDAKTRPTIAAALARRLGCVVVLKGSRTVVSDGSRVYINGTGGPWLSTGGTGDVLAGVIGGLLAQHTALSGSSDDLFRLACIGVLVHGRAGDAWAKQHRATGGMLAAELAGLIAPEIERLRR